MSVLSSSFRVCLFVFKDLMIASSFFVTSPSQIPKRVKKITKPNSEISVFTGKYFKYMCS